MKVKILTEINPHADGVHCGRCNKIEFDTDCAEFQEPLELDNELCTPLRCAKCLAAQKEAEGMTAMKRSDFDELIEDIKIEVFGYGGTNWIPQINKLLDRFYPVPQTIEQELKKYDSLERQ